MDATSKFKDRLPTTPETLLTLLDRLQIAYKIYRHPPLRTVEDSKAHRNNMPGLHIKNLYLRDRKKKNFLLVAEEDRQIDMKSLHQKIGLNVCLLAVQNDCLKCWECGPVRSVH